MKTTSFEKSIILDAKKYVHEMLKQDTSGHDYFHIERVYEMAKFLTTGLEVDLFVVELSSLLHDLDDPKISKKGSKFVFDFIDPLLINEDRKRHIYEVISNMSYSKHKEGKEVLSLEGKIVQDADRLDAIGAIGIARCFAYGGSKSRPIYQNNKDDESSIAHFYQKLLLLKDLMNLESSKKIAIDRTDFMQLFLDRFYQDWNIKTN
ncbi:MAG: HD domain-containing protein [Candidatus Izemoplasmatales bacterium]|nr:HD domain-containing protein [Candidatus Izemoplasmatales bacterium]